MLYFDPESLKTKNVLKYPSFSQLTIMFAKNNHGETRIDNARIFSEGKSIRPLMYSEYLDIWQRARLNGCILLYK